MKTMKMISSRGKEIDLSAKSVDSLNSALSGNLLRSGDERYDEFRAIWNGMIDKKPALIVRCKDSKDVINAVNFARDNDLLISVRSGGHHVSGKSLCDGGMVIDLSLMRDVKVDPENRTAMVQGGAKLGDIDKETHKFGLVAPLGVVSATGVAGLTLHGYQ